MMLYAACLSAAVALVSAEAPIEDFTDAIHMKYFYPNDPNNPSDRLRVRCSVNVNGTEFASLTKLKIFYSNSSEPASFEPLGALTEDKMAKNDIAVWGKYKVNTDHWSKLDITWSEEDMGYCQYYKCLATGRHPEMNKLLALYKIIYVEAPLGETCETNCTVSGANKFDHGTN